MISVSTTLAVGDETPTVIAGMLQGFPKGSRVRLAIASEPMIEPPLSLEEYRRIFAEARRQAPPCPWSTTAAAMKVLREGETDV